MISKMPHLNWFKEDIKTRILSIVLSCIVEFLIFPVLALSFFQQRADDVMPDYIIDTFLRQVLSGCTILVAVVGAIICAYGGFSYLFSKKKVDLYHSLPINRKNIFITKYVDGILIYVIPFLAFMLLAFPIYMANVKFDANIICAFFRLFITGLICFLIIYNICILGCMIAGDFTSAIFFTITIGGYFFIFWKLINSYMDAFFDTYLHANEKMETFFELLSPFVYIAKRAMHSEEIIFEILLIIISLVISYFLFINRKMEMAGNGGIYRMVNVIFRFGVCVIASLLSAYIFSILNNEMTSWLIFGAIFGCIISHILINSMFNRSIKGAIKDKTYLIAAFLISLSMALCLKYDCIGYDNYIPNKEEISSIGIYNSEKMIDAQKACLDYKFNDEDTVKYNFENTIYLNSEIIKIENTDKIYNLVLELKNNALKLAKDTHSNTSGAIPYSGYMNRYGEGSSSFEVTYNKKNGDRVNRIYRISMNEMNDKIVALLKSDEYKNAIFNAIAGSDVDKLTSAYIKCYENDRYCLINNISDTEGRLYKNRDDFSIIFNKEYAKKLYEAYKMDMYQMTSKQLKYLPEIKVSLNFVYDNQKTSDIYTNIKIYPCNFRTLKLLEKYLKYTDIYSQFYNDKILENLSTIEISSYGDKIKTLTDKNEMKNIWQMMLNSYANDGNMIENGDFLEVKFVYNNGYSFDLRILSEDLKNFTK